MEPTVLILIDALGFELSRRHGFSPDGLPFEARLETVLGFSQAALTSILTGAPPSSHGNWMMYGFDGERSQFGILGPLRPLGGVDRLWIRRLIRWKLRRIDGVDSYFSLYSIPGEVLVNMYLPARSAQFSERGGGRLRSIVDEAAVSPGGLFVRDHRTEEGRAFEDLRAALGERRKDLYILYTAGLDSDLHAYGTEDRRIGDRLGMYSKFIGSLTSEFPGMRFIVMGDHGMCDVRDRIDLIGLVGGAGLEPLADYVPFYDATMARFSCRRPGAAEALREILEGVEGGRLLSDSELEELGVHFPGGEFGDLIFLCETGRIILPSYMGREPVKGMHGYHPSASCMDSVMFSSEEFGADRSSVTDVAPFIFPGFTPGEERE